MQSIDNGVASDLTLPQVLERAACRRTPTIWDGSRWRSWHDLRIQAEHTAAALSRGGVRPGDVVAAQLPNGWQLLALHAAIARLGATLLPLHLAYGTHEVRSLLDRANATALVVRRDDHRGRDRSPDVRDIAAAAGGLRRVWVSSGDADPDLPARLTDAAELFAPAAPGVGLVDPPRDPLAPLVLLASSGTTSRRPKLCVHSHRGLLTNALAVASDGDFGPSDIIVSASPFSHAFGLLSVHLAMVTGGAVAAVHGWEPAAFLATLRHVRATAVFAVPAQLRDLVSRPRRPIDSLREVRTGGAPVPLPLVSAIEHELGARVTVQWGMTEVGAGTHTRPGDPPASASTIGKPVSGAEARVVGPDGRTVPPGQTGELQYRSPYQFHGYLGDEQATRSTFTEDGWLRTGDLACANIDGSVSYRGRSDERINRGGMKFSALEVEELLTDLPQLRQHAVIGYADPRLGQKACLLAVLRDGADLTLDEVVDHLSRKGLAIYKLPERLMVLDELPTTVTGKIARARLRDLPVPSETSS